MKRLDLIKALQESNIEEVFIVDYFENLKSDSGEGSCDHIHDFEVDEVKDSDKPWISLAFNVRTE